MFNFLAPIKSYLYGAILLILISAIGSAAYYRHKASQEHDNAILSQQAMAETTANYNATVAAIDALNSQISQLEGEYDLARYEAQTAKDDLARHHIQDDLVAKPLLTLDAINAGTKRMLDQIRCASDTRCTSNDANDSKTSTHPDKDGNVADLSKR